MQTIKWALLTLLSLAGLVLATAAIPIHVLYRSFSTRYDLPYYLRRVAVGNDVQCGAMIYGSKHTISAITGYRAARGDRWHKLQEIFIDYFFGKNHCRNEAIDENLIRETT